MTTLNLTPRPLGELTQEDWIFDLVCDWAPDHDHGILLPGGRLLIAEPHSMDGWQCIYRLRAMSEDRVIPDGWRAEADGSVVPCEWSPRDSTPDPWHMDVSPRYLDKGIRWSVPMGQAHRTVDALYVAIYGLGREALRAYLKGTEGMMAQVTYAQYRKAQEQETKARYAKEAARAALDRMLGS